MTMSYKHCRYIQRRSVLKNDNTKYVKLWVLSKLKYPETNDNKYPHRKCICYMVMSIIRHHVIILLPHEIKPPGIYIRHVKMRAMCLVSYHVIVKVSEKERA